jgi:hypothetical protein
MKQRSAWTATLAVLVAGAGLAAAEPPQTSAAAADPVVTTLNQLVDNLSAFDKAPDDAAKPAAKVRDKKESAAIIGTAAAIGSALGALIAKDDRGKGAAVGAAVGGIAGLIYDRMTAKGKPDPQSKPVPAATVPDAAEKRLL